MDAAHCTLHSSQQTPNYPTLPYRRLSGNDFIIALLTPLSSALSAAIFVAAGATALSAYGQPSCLPCFRTGWPAAACCKCPAAAPGCAPTSNSAVVQPAAFPAA